MDPTRLDRIATLFAQRRLSRRHAVQQGAGAIAAGTLAAAGLVQATAAQDATPAAPVASPIAGSTVAEPNKTSFLFVQTFGAGELAPKAGEEGTLTLTADHLAGQTIYFSDRPERIVGTVPTERFLGTGRTATGTPEGGLGFGPADPPNAALVFASAEGDDAPGDALVVELIDPTYDPATGRATYDVKVLADETAVDLTLVSEPLAAADAIRQFEAASLFIDDCPNDGIVCMKGTDSVAGMGNNLPFCYNYLVCIPCEPYGSVQPDRCATVDYWSDRCNNEITACQDECIGYFWNADLLCPRS